jgi:Thermostable hemolysin
VIISSLQTPSALPLVRQQLLERLISPLPEFQLTTSKDPAAEPTKLFVQHCYRRAYGAEVQHFLPWLLTMNCIRHCSGVAGLQPATVKPLFLEQYLNDSIERLLSHRSGESVGRTSIVEVGNLVALRKGASHLLFLVFTAVLHARGYEWIVFTATKALRNNLNKLGFALTELAAIDPTALPPAVQSEWGSYYQTEPKVMAGRLSDAMALINSRTLYRHVLKLYQPLINQLAAQLPAGKSHVV